MKGISVRLTSLTKPLAVLLGAAMFLTVTACNPAEQAKQDADPSASQSELTKVTMQIDGSAVPYYAPLYVAQDEGYFAKHGLDVEFTYAQGSNILQNVAAGNVEFGFPNGDSVVTAQGKGVTVNVVHTTYQQGIGALLFSGSAGINGPADLKGKKVAVTDLGSPNYAQLQAMLASANLTVADVDVQVIGTGAIVDSLKGGDVDAIVFSRLRYYALKNAEFDVAQILSDEYLPSFGNVVVTSPDMVKDKPEVVKGFTDALNEGIQYTIDNPAKAVSMAISKYADSFSGQDADITKVIEEVFIPDLWQSEFTKKDGLGYGDVERWQAAIDAQVKFEIIPESYDAKKLVVQPSELGR